MNIGISVLAVLFIGIPLGLWMGVSYMRSAWGAEIRWRYGSRDG